MSKRMSTRLLAGIATVAFGASALVARADEVTKAAEAKPAVEANVAAAGNRLDVKKLNDLLSNMGYDAKKVNDTTYEVMLKRDGWTVHFQLSFSVDGTRLWVLTNLADIADIGKVPQEALVGMAEANYTQSPTFFYIYNPKDTKKPAFRYLKVARRMDTTTVNAKVLREHMDGLFTNIRDTKPLWMPSEWSKVKVAAPTAERDIAQLVK